MRSLFCFLLTLCCLPAFSQNAANGLSGTVTDSITRQPIDGANVYFPDLKRGAVTSNTGEYRITGITAGNHLVEVSHIGYNTISQNVFVRGISNLNFNLGTEVVEQHAVVVTGVTRATKLKSMPFQVDVLNRAALGKVTATNLIESITGLPGVSSTTTGPAISKPVIRGMGYNRVITLTDGMRQEGQQWGDEHGIEVDEFSVNKVEVLKGPAALIYGGDAMGGVINIIQNVPAPAKRFTAEVGSGYQTNNRERYGFANLAANHGGFNWRLYGSKKAAADYQNKYDGYVFNSKFKEENLGGYVGYNSNWGFTHLIFNSYQNTPGLIEGERDAEGHFLKLLPSGDEVPVTEKDFSTPTPFIPYQKIRHQKIALDNHFNIGQQHLSINTGWQRNRRQEFGDAQDPNANELYFDLKTFTYNARLDFETGGGWKPSLGLNGMIQQNKNRGEEQIIPDYRSGDFGVFAYTQKDLSKITLSGGLRFDLKKMNVENLMDGTDIKGAQFNRSFNNFSGSAGLAYQATDALVLKFNVARAFRAPAVNELASNGRHEGTNRYEYGNNTLKSETSFQTDISADYESEHLHFSAAGYYNHFDNYIFYNKLLGINRTDSLIEVDGSFVPAFQFAQSNAFIAGMEVVLDLHPHPVHWLHLENTFSMLAGRFNQAKDGSKNLPYMPAPKLNTELRADISKAGKTIKNAFIKFDLENVFAQNQAFTGYNTETPTPGYTLVHAGFGGSITNSKENMIATISFIAQNITDKAYQNHLSRLKYAPENVATGRTGVYNMGRNFSIKLAVPLSFKLK